MSSPMHHPHQQRYHKSIHIQVRRAPLPVYLVHHIYKEDTERSDMVNHLNPMTLVVQGHRANVT
jgi:hypothetical protein